MRQRLQSPRQASSQTRTARIRTPRPWFRAQRGASSCALNHRRVAAQLTPVSEALRKTRPQRRAGATARHCTSASAASRSRSSSASPSTCACSSLPLRVLVCKLNLIVYRWWRQNQQPSDGDRRREGREERSLGKGPVRTHPTPLRSLTEALTHPTLQKQPRRRPKLLVIPSVERAALLSPDDLERGGLSSSPLSATSSRSSASSSSSSSDERDIGRRRKKGRAG